MVISDHSLIAAIISARCDNWNHFRRICIGLMWLLYDCYLNRIWYFRAIIFLWKSQFNSPCNYFINYTFGISCDWHDKCHQMGNNVIRIHFYKLCQWICIVEIVNKAIKSNHLQIISQLKWFSKNKYILKENCWLEIYP